MTVKNYYPTDIGNTWVLETSNRGKQRIYTLEGPETIDGKALIRLRIVTKSLGANTSNTCQHFVTASDEGLNIHRTTLEDVRAGNVTAIFSPPATFFRFPLTLGDKWSIGTSTRLKGLLSAKIGIDVAVVGLENVETSAGTFEDCFKIELKTHVSAMFVNMRSTTYLWLAPDVGPVRFQESESSIFTLVNSNLLGVPE